MVDANGKAIIELSKKLGNNVCADCSSKSKYIIFYLNLCDFYPKFVPVGV